MKCQYEVATGDKLVRTRSGTYYGYVVTVAVAVNPIDIRDAGEAGGGAIIDTIPANTAAGTQRVLPHGIRCPSGIFADYGAGATGTVTILHDN